MGGSYREDYSSCSRQIYRESIPEWKELLTSALKNKSRSKLTEAYKQFFSPSSFQNSGFIAQTAKLLGINDASQIPKEFSEIEYEVKFDISAEAGKGKEPSIEEYLSTFDFPVATQARFLKDPVNAIAEGTNRFFGSSSDERLVIITKGGGTYLKEKGEVAAVDVGVPYQDLVVKRTEKRYPADIDQVANKLSEICSENDVKYRGRIRKEKGDIFILDSNDGRIYSYTITRSHLTKSGENKEIGIQRQLEIEYAGYLPGFVSFEKDSEKQIVSGMVDLAKYTYGLYSSAPVARGWKINLLPTHERKYDFVSGIEVKGIKKLPKLKQLEVIVQ